MLPKLFAKFKYKLLTVSVRGPGHIKNDSPNQDCAYGDFVGKFLLVMACDGLGSHLHSDYGAKTLCALFPDCFLEWSKYRSNKIDDLLGLLQSRWLIRVRSLGVDTCGCTCQLAILNPKGKGWIAQLGDGMTLARHNGKICKYTEEKDGYANETMSMGEGNLQPCWRKSKIDLSTTGDRLIIMTDGVSEDILPQAEEKFTQTFDLFFGTSRSKGQNALKKELTNWPTPHHLDDKTIIAVEYR